MELTLPPQLDTGTALRYLGAAGWTPDDGTARLLAGAESALRAAATPRGGCPSRRCRWRGRGATWPATCRAAPAWC